MSEQVRLALLDTVFTVSGPGPLVADLGRLFPDASPAAGAAERLVEVQPDAVLLDGEVAHRVARPALLLETVLMALNAAAVEDVRCFAVHAGAVARDGAVLAWPGVSGAGKTTLTAACLRAGFDYVSDEALVLDGEQVRAYPKPLTLSDWSLAAVGLAPPPPGLAERAVVPAELGAAHADGSLALNHLVLLERRPGPASLSPAGAAQGAHALLQYSFNHYRAPEAAFATATAAAARARVWRLGYERPEEGARSLLEAVAGLTAGW